MSLDELKTAGRTILVQARKIAAARALELNDLPLDATPVFSHGPKGSIPPLWHKIAGVRGETNALKERAIKEGWVHTGEQAALAKECDALEKLLNE